MTLLVGRPEGKNELVEICEDRWETVYDYRCRYPNLTANGISSWDYLEVRKLRKGKDKGYDVIDSESYEPY
jgi:hypothetical protein